jgi:hypothetical protein
MKCSFCHKEIVAAKIHIRDECPACGRDLHICLNCEFFDANAYRQCRDLSVNRSRIRKKRITVIFSGPQKVEQPRAAQKMMPSRN